MTNVSVTSADGTMIAYERQGNGDPVIVVNTVAEDRSGLSGLAGLLAEHFTVYTYTHTPTHMTAGSAPVPRTAGRCQGIAGVLKLPCSWRSVRTVSRTSVTAPVILPRSCRT